MSAPDLLPAAWAALFEPLATLGGSPVTLAEIVACVLSIAMVGCNLIVNPIGWPLAIASSALYGALFAHSRLYGEAALQGFFIVVAFWGWREWLRGRGDDGEALRVHRLDGRHRFGIGMATLAAWPLLGLVLGRFTDTDVPFLDALPTVGSIAGQFLLGRKLVENWAVWLAVNLWSLVLFGLKGLWLTVALYAVFAALSVVGWRAWQALLAKDAPAP